MEKLTVLEFGGQYAMFYTSGAFGATPRYCKSVSHNLLKEK